MKISQLLLNITDYTSGVGIKQTYILGAYTTFDKANEAQAFFLNTVFVSLKVINRQVDELRADIRLKAKQAGEPNNVNIWEDEVLKTQWKEADKPLTIFMDKYLEHAKGAFYPLIEENCADEFEMEFKIINLEVQ
jgi:hypothetical protein